MVNTASSHHDDAARNRLAATCWLAARFTSDCTLLLASIDRFQGTKLRSSTLDKLDGYYQDLALAEQLSA